MMREKGGGGKQSEQGTAGTQQHKLQQHKLQQHKLQQHKLHQLYACFFKPMDTPRHG
jgi:hypothetical protein